MLTQSDLKDFVGKTVYVSYNPAGLQIKGTLMKASKNSILLHDEDEATAKTYQHVLPYDDIKMITVAEDVIEE